MYVRINCIVAVYSTVCVLTRLPSPEPVVWIRIFLGGVLVHEFRVNELQKILAVLLRFRY